MVLDVNTEIYPLSENMKLSIIITTSLNLHGSDVKRDYWRGNIKERTLLDDYEYVVSGRCYKVDESGDNGVYVILFFFVYLYVATS